MSDLVRHPLTGLPPALDRVVGRFAGMWFFDGGHGWSPRAYEWFFTRTWGGAGFLVRDLGA